MKNVPVAVNRPWYKDGGVSRKWRVAAAVGFAAVMAAVPSFAETYTLTSFGLDTVVAGLVAFFLLAAAGIAAMLVPGLSLEVGVATIMKYARKVFGGR